MSDNNPTKCPKCGSTEIQSVELLQGGCATYEGDFMGYTDVWWDGSATIYWNCRDCEHDWGDEDTQETLRHEIRALLALYRSNRAKVAV